MTKSSIPFSFYLSQANMLSYLEHYILALGLKTINLGKSQEGRVITEYTWGKGAICVAIWSQMHGNESTGTFCIYDLLESILGLSTKKRDLLSKQVTLRILPVLNPDGAFRYTRESANGVDLNRDSIDKSTPEIKLFWDWIDRIKPDLALNLHDQRSRFSADGKVATLSFLAPSPNVEREITPARAVSMRAISRMHKHLSNIHSVGMGKYTDEFYPTATGDNLMAKGISNILFEAGADSQTAESREIARGLQSEGMWFLLENLHEVIAPQRVSEDDLLSYSNIPENKASMCDYIYHTEPSIPFPEGQVVELDINRNWSVEKGLKMDITVRGIGTKAMLTNVYKIPDSIQQKLTNVTDFVVNEKIEL